jgi:hypothetical protein
MGSSTVLARLIEIAIEVAGQAPARLGRDHRGLPGGSQWREDPFIGIEGLVGDQRFGLHRGQELSAPTRSWACPPVRKKPTGLPSASTRVWILVLNPPRERPMMHHYTLGPHT